MCICHAGIVIERYTEWGSELLVDKETAGVHALLCVGVYVYECTYKFHNILFGAFRVYIYMHVNFTVVSVVFTTVLICCLENVLRGLINTHRTLVWEIVKQLKILFHFCLLPRF